MFANLTDVADYLRSRLGASQNLEQRKEFQHFRLERYLFWCSAYEPTPRKVPLLDSLASLAAAAAGGSAPATSDLLERVWPDAYRIAWSVLGERTAAEDAAQEACARLWTSIATLRQPGAFAGWFYRIVVNEAKRRRRTLQRTQSLAATAAPDAGAAPEDRIDLARALQALDPPLRVATVLRYYYDFNGNEIARIVGASPVTVRWRLFLARRRLRAMLGLSATSSHGLTTNRIGAYADEPQSIR